MRFAAFVATIASCDAAALADPCVRLCQFDGPAICTGGSWSKGAGICHAYFHNANGHCYHTSATRETCPSSGRPVRADEVDGMIGAAQAPTSTTARPMSTTVAPIRTTSAPEDQVLYTPMPITAEDADAANLGDVEPQYIPMVKEIIRIHHFDLGNANRWGESGTIIRQGALALQETAHRNEDPVQLFRRVRGHLLLQFVSSPTLLREALFLAVSVPVQPLEVERFRRESGLRGFCIRNAEHIRRLAIDFALSHSRRRSFPTMEEASKHAIGISWLPRFCPELMERYPDMRMAVIGARAYRSLLSEPGMEAIQHQPLTIPAVSPNRPFSDAMRLIMERDPRSLRMLLGSVGGERASVEAVYDFIAAAGREIAATLFGGNNFINQEAPLEAFEPAGRLVAMSIIHHVHLGLQLPQVLLACLVGEDFTLDILSPDFPALSMAIQVIVSELAEAVEIDGELVPVTRDNKEELIQRLIAGRFPPAWRERIAAFHRGFESVIYPGLLDGVVTAQQLGEMLSGDLQISIDQLFESAEFYRSDYGRDSQPVQWFGEYLESLSPAELRGFVTRLTGMQQLPPRGLAPGNPTFHCYFHRLGAPMYVAEIRAHNYYLHVPDFGTREEMFRAFDEFLNRA